MTITCPFCKDAMYAVSPHAIVQPAFRCSKCNVRIVVTNPSYMPPGRLFEYRKTVEEGRLTRYQAMNKEVTP